MRRLTLRLDMQTRPIIGAVEYEDGSQADFNGWLGLLSILETLAPMPPGPSRRLNIPAARTLDPASPSVD
jgi:hypothetical protein